MLAAAVVVHHEAKQRVPTDTKKTFFGHYDLWMYNAVLDKRVCLVCIGHERQPRMYGSQLRSTFPYLRILNDDTIGGSEPGGDGLAHPNCRCRLQRIIKWSPEDVKWFVKYGPKI